MNRYTEIIRTWPGASDIDFPALRLGVTGMGSRNGTGRLINAVQQTRDLPVEVFSLGYVFDDGGPRCLHSIADSLCELASDEARWTDAYEKLNNASAQAADQLWKAVARGRRTAMLLIDHTYITPDWVTRIESELDLYCPAQSRLSFVKPSVEAWDERNGPRQVMMGEIG
jgi:hypothetical protein